MNQCTRQKISYLIVQTICTPSRRQFRLQTYFLPNEVVVLQIQIANLFLEFLDLFRMFRLHPRDLGAKLVNLYGGNVIKTNVQKIGIY
jgi:hypothetical protein